MNPRVAVPPSARVVEPQLRPHVLLVDTDPDALRRVGSRLSEEGYRVATASSLEAAKTRFEDVKPELLVVAVRLEAFNGLHLAIWLRFGHPNLPVIITHTSHDRVLETDARRLGLEFVVEPLKNPEFWQYLRDAVGDPRPHHARTVARRYGGA